MNPLKKKLSQLSRMALLLLLIAPLANAPYQSAAAADSARSLATTLALTPPMGWNHYNTFGNSVDETMLHAIADAMVTHGMVAAGYVQFNIDDSWQGSRDGSGNIQANSNYPSGIKALADYVHSKGMKFGIYTTPTATSCGGHTGSLGHEQQDVNSFASWGVDYIKLDWCCADYSQSGSTAIANLWLNAITNSGRPMVLSVNAGSGAYPWMSSLANLWRTGDDICDQWTESAVNTTYHCYQGNHKGGIIDLINNSNLQASAPYAQPGHWSDPDMMEVGGPGNGLTFDESKSHFSIWAISAAPLLAGNDPRNMTGSDTASQIMLNSEVIAIDQDALGKQGTKVKDTSGLQVWMKPLQSGEKAVVLFNTTGASSSMTVNWSDIGLSGTLAVRDLWAKQNLGNFTNSYSATVPSHGVVMIKVSSTGGPTNTPLPPTATPTKTNTPVATNTPGGAVISNLSVKDTANAASWSIQANLQVGNTQFGDRAYTLTTVPALVQGAAWIRTANASKSYTGNPTVTFDVGQAATVYVAVDDRLGKLSWMDATWTDSGQNLVNNETTPVTLSLWQKSYLAGSVSLGPTNSTFDFYTVVVVPSGGGATATPTSTLTRTNTPAPPTATPTPGSGGNTHAGTWALKSVFTSTASWKNAQEQPSVTGSQTYVASVWIKGTGSVQLQVMNGNWGTAIVTVRCDATGSWTQCSSGSFSTGTNTMLTYAFRDGYGVASILYLDDAFLGVSGGSNVLSNAGFESGNVNWILDTGGQYTILQP